jgi:hypothetical protein
LGEFIILFSKSKVEDEGKLSLGKELNGSMRGGLCLQYISLTLARALCEEAKEKLFVVAKKRFPLLKKIELNN